jgi:predicted nucleic acid-binding protein
MILYLDASALVKCYVAERGSDLVQAVLAEAEVAATALISRAEVAAAFGKAVRMRVLPREMAQLGLEAFYSQWPDFVRIQVNETVVARAGALAWEHGLRGYDAVHLAAATGWAEAMNEQVTLATFDVALWQAATRTGLAGCPAALPQLLEGWREAR